MHAHYTEGVARPEGREGVNGDGDGDGDGDGSGSRNGDGKGDWNLDGMREESLVSTISEAKKSRRPGNAILRASSFLYTGGGACRYPAALGVRLGACPTMWFRRENKA